MVAGWLDANVEPNETIAYFGAPQKLPRLRADIRTAQAADWCSEEEWHAMRPEFVVIIPQQHFEIEHEWRMADSVYARLVEGTLGYDRVLYAQTRLVWSRRPVPFVNPPVQVFVRRDRRSAEMALTVAAPKPLLHAVEERLHLTPTFPPGLVHNANRAPLPCSGERGAVGPALGADMREGAP